MSGPTNTSSFGERYELSPEATRLVVTNQRTPPEVLSGSLECAVCTDTKPVTDFPRAAITKTCAHAPTTCTACVAASIRSDLSTKLWSEVRCPECRAPLDYDDVQRYADADSRERYQALSLRHLLSEEDNFVWCAAAGCGYGQVHVGGAASPIVVCARCGARSCFAHRVAWHGSMGCDEYDALRADPENFRSRFEVENEAAEEAERARRAREEADRAYAVSLAEELRAEEVARQEGVARRAWEREEREERARAEKRRAAQAMRAEVARKKREEEESMRTVARTTKPCPGCGWAIEKISGW